MDLRVHPRKSPGSQVFVDICDVTLTPRIGYRRDDLFL